MAITDATRPGRGLFVRAAGTAALAGLLFGFDTAVISGVTGAVSTHFALDPVQLGTTVSAALWGTLVGAMTAGQPGDRFGARAVLRVLALFYVASGIGCALAWDWTSLLAFRFIGGLAIGGLRYWPRSIFPKSRRPRDAGCWSACSSSRS